MSGTMILSSVMPRTAYASLDSLSSENSPYLAKIQRENPDLTSEDAKIAAEFYGAYKNRTGIKGLIYRKSAIARFQEAKKNFLDRMGELTAMLNKSDLPLNKRMNIIARLMNMHGILLATDYVTISDVISASKYDKTISARASAEPLDSIWTSPLAVTPQQIEDAAKRGDKTAKQIMGYLCLEKEKGYTYLQFIKDNIKGIIFLPDHRPHLKLFANFPMRGGIEQLCKYGIAVTNNIKTGDRRDAHVLAETLVWDAAMIEYFNDPAKANDASLLKPNPYMAYGDSVSAKFIAATKSVKNQ